MHDIWNPWHGCVKFSEGCQNCYMYFLDKMRGQSGAQIYKVKNNFYYPLAKDRQGNYKIKSGEMVRVCMTSDFFLDRADIWREEAWQIMRFSFNNEAHLQSGGVSAEKLEWRLGKCFSDGNV